MSMFVYVGWVLLKSWCDCQSKGADLSCDETLASVFGFIQPMGLTSVNISSCANLCDVCLGLASFYQTNELCTLTRSCKIKKVYFFIIQRDCFHPAVCSFGSNQL